MTTTGEIQQADGEIEVHEAGLSVPTERQSPPPPAARWSRPYL